MTVHSEISEPIEGYSPDEELMVLAHGPGADQTHGVPVSSEMLRAIRRIIRRVSLHSRTLSRSVGLTLPQIIVLRTIAESDEPPTGRQVAAWVQLSPPTVSGILDRLERMDLIARDRSRVDRRRVLLSLTEEGRRRVQGMPAPLQEEFVARVAALPAERQLELLRSLEEIVTLMEAQSIDAAPILSADTTLHRD